MPSNAPRRSWRSRPPVAALIGALLLLPGALGAPTALPAQGGVRLLVVDDETGEPIPGAVIRIKGRSPDLTTAESGKVLLDSLPPGRLEVEIRAIGYELRKESFQVQAGPVHERRIGLSFTGEQLADIVVEARREKLSGRYQDFNRRMAGRGGVFITWEEIKARNYTRLGDALRNLRGVHVLCRHLDCTISMSRSSFCAPKIWVDGSESEYFGVNTPIGDVYGIEVYRGAGDIPVEFSGTSGCGAVVIWTKNRPYR